MCDIEMTVNLIKGLKADLCREVAMLNPTTFNQALKFAKTVESKKKLMKCNEKEIYLKPHLRYKNVRQNRTNWTSL